jgi:hypothetical protein
MSGWVCILPSLVLFSLIIFYTNCVMPGPFCSFSLFLFLLLFRLYDVRIHAEWRSSHRIWCHYRRSYEEYPLDFFRRQACLVRSHSSLYIFFLFNMQARKKEENWSYRFVYIIDWPLLIQGQHIMFLLGSYSFIHFFCARMNEWISRYRLNIET